MKTLIAIAVFSGSLAFACALALAASAYFLHRTAQAYIRAQVPGGCEHPKPQAAQAVCPEHRKPRPRKTFDAAQDTGGRARRTVQAPATHGMTQSAQPRPQAKASKRQYDCIVPGCTNPPKRGGVPVCKGCWTTLGADQCRELHRLHKQARQAAQEPPTPGKHVYAPQKPKPAGKVTRKAKARAKPAEGNTNPTVSNTRPGQAPVAQTKPVETSRDDKRKPVLDADGNPVLCACGCKTPLTGRQTKYASRTCSSKGFTAKVTAQVREELAQEAEQAQTVAEAVALSLVAQKARLADALGCDVNELDRMLETVEGIG